MATIKWDNDQFISAFFSGGLKRKREYGNLYVIDGEKCQLLMYKTPRSPETLIGIKFPDSSISLTQDNGALSRFLSISSLPASANTLNINMESFIRGYDATKMKLVNCKFINPASGTNPIASALIEIEGTRWLVDYNLSTEKGLTINKFREGYVTENQIRPSSEQRHLHRILYKVSSHVNSVIEARESLIPTDVEEAFFYDNMWFIPAEDGFNPYEVSEEDLTILRNPPSRFQYDLGPEFDDVNAICRTLGSNIMTKVMDKLPEDIGARLNEYLEAHLRYVSTKEKYSTVIENNFLSGFRVSTGKKATAGVFKNEYEEVFLRGEIFNMKNSVSYQNYGYIKADCLPQGDKFGNQIVSLKGWHKLVPLEII